MVCPVTQLAASLARNMTTLATSSGPPMRPDGMLDRMPLYKVGLCCLAWSQTPAWEFDRPRRHAIDPNPLGRQGRGLRERVLDQGCLHRAVRRRANRRRQTGDRRDVHDRALAGQQMRHRCLRRPHRGHQVDRYARGPALFVVRAAETGGVVHQHVDAAQRIGCRSHVATHRRPVGQVAHGRVNLLAVAGDFRFGLTQRIFATGAISTPVRPPARNPTRSIDRYRGCRPRRRPACL